MELNYDCARAVLDALVTSLVPDDLPGAVAFPTIEARELCAHATLSGYSMADVIYSVNQLRQAGMIQAEPRVYEHGGETYIIKDVTYDGHMFLKSLGNDSSWAEIKKLISKAGSVSVPVLLKVASEFTLKKIFS